MKATTKDHPRLKLQVFGTLLGASLLASLAGIPYSIALLKQQAPPIGAMLLGVLLQLAITALIAALGLWLGSKVRLGVPILRRLLAGTPDALPRFLASLRPAISLGVIGGGLLLIASFALKPLLPPALVQTEIPGPLPALLGSVSAGVNEEIWLRLGLMTCLVWLGSKLIRQLRPGVRVIWVANVLAALLFGVLHLPQVAMLAEGLTLVVITYTLLLNGIVGTIFGWLYWQQGLLAAVLAHFSTDVVIKVIPALAIYFIPALGS